MPQATISASKKKNSILKSGLEIHRSWCVFGVNRPDFTWWAMGWIKTSFINNENIRSWPRRAMLAKLQPTGLDKVLYEPIQAGSLISMGQ